MRNIKPLLLLLSLAGCVQLFAQDGFEFKNIKEINTNRLDFSPIPYGDGLIFTSSKSNRFLQCPSDNPGDYTDVYYAPKKTDGTFGEKQLLKGGINGKYNDGVVALSPDGKKMIFTRNNLSGKNSMDIIDLKLYSADLTGDSWTNVTPLPFNSDDWSTAHPALSKDGTLLVFSSNRTGSKDGSMDLWSAKMENGVWSIPENLGTALNTSGSELFPYIDEFGNLFFSSNGHGGAGGLDLFAAKQGANGQWEMIGNLGAPINTGGDDVSFVPLNGGTEGYYAGERSGGNGLDDIWHWKYTPVSTDVMIVVVDKVTQERLPASKLEIIPTEFATMMDKIYGGGAVAARAISNETDRNGSFSFTARKGTKYAITTNKTAYKSDKRQVSYEELAARPEYIIPLEKDYARLIVQVVEDPSGNPIPLADIKILDKTTGKVVTLTGDGEGSANTQIDCDHEYEITASKRPYYDNTVTLKDFKLDCSDGQVKVVVRLKQPLIVILEPIFFDFDRYYIRKRDAAPTLDSLVIIMNRFPSLQVRLEAHCDARGSTPYNDVLSVNRANSAKKYLVQKGIAAARIATKDYGERNPANECKDNVYCPEPAHQINRRVDVVPERHQEGGVDFKTRDLKQMNVQSDRK